MLSGLAFLFISFMFSCFLTLSRYLGYFLAVLCFGFDSDSASAYTGTRMTCTQLHNTSKSAVSNLSFRPILP